MRGQKQEEILWIEYTLINDMVEEIQGSMRWENKMRQNQSSMKVSKTLKEVLQQKNKENTIGSIKSKVRIGH